MQRMLHNVDLSTGEVADGVLVYVPRRQMPASYKEGYVMNRQAALTAIARDPDLGAEALKVFLYLNGTLDFENFIQVSQSDVADALGMNRHNVNRAFKLLASKTILLEGPKVGRSRCYRWNPNVGWKGKVVTLNRALRVIEGGQNGQESRDPNTRNMFEQQ